ncbi:MAG: ATP synthase subunit I [Chromatiales bacterium]|jgi:F1F0 ATPase subunit 2
MSTSDYALITLSAAAGLVLGAVYFLGLWVTVRRLPEAEHPMVLLGISLVTRMSVLLTGLWLIGRDGHWERLVAAMVGVVLARFLVMRRLPSDELSR